MQGQNRCEALGALVPVHRQEQLLHALIVRFVCIRTSFRFSKMQKLYDCVSDPTWNSLINVMSKGMRKGMAKIVTFWSRWRRRFVASSSSSSSSSVIPGGCTINMD